MGSLSSTDEWLDDRTGKVDRVQAGQGRQKLAAVDGKVSNAGDRTGGQGRLQDRAASRKRRSWDRGRDPCYAPPMGTLLP